MQEEITQKTVVLCFRGGKVTARMLKAALRALLNLWKDWKTKQPRTANGAVISRGKQSLKQLQDQGAELTNIEITEDNIRSFERVARKYGVDFSLKKNEAVQPPRVFVFFKARDEKVMEAAFKEYAAQNMKKRKPSIREKIREHAKEIALHKERVRTRNLNRSRT